MRISVLGSGSWGTALAILLGRKGYEVVLWSRRTEQAAQMQSTRENTQYLPGFPLPDSVACTGDLNETLTGSSTVVIAVPSTAVRDVAHELVGQLSTGTLLVHAGKGLESETGMRGSEVIAEELGESIAKECVILSGPNLSNELVRTVPSATVVASQTVDAATRAQELFHSGSLRVYRASDVIGVELGGALKNVMAIGAGICDGMGFGDNTKAALVTRGLKEMVRLGTVMGADPATFTGLSGIGDLMATCSSKLSRNLRMGLMLGIGKSVAESMATLGQVAEGVHTCKAAYILSKKHDVDMPITAQLYGILFEGKSPTQGLIELMDRSYKEEKL
jgi:glycerol-3-phosphate dehydrogenase (NAD(P)+)